MAEPRVSKLTKPERREQLLESALAMVRAEGTEALTLARLAEHAGVSKPVAYEHFTTREGLLIALCRWLDDRQSDALATALAGTAPELAAVAHTLADGYVRCALAIGREWSALNAALRGSATMQAVQRELAERYAKLWRDALAPFAGSAGSDLKLRTRAMLAAAEAIANAVLDREVPRARAVATLTGLIPAMLAT